MATLKYTHIISVRTYQMIVGAVTAAKAIIKSIPQMNWTLLTGGSEAVCCSIHVR